MSWKVQIVAAVIICLWFILAGEHFIPALFLAGVVIGLVLLVYWAFESLFKRNNSWPRRDKDGSKL